MTSLPDGRRRTSEHEAVVELELPGGRSFDAVGRLVAAGIADRAGLAVDRIDDLQLALQAVRRDPGTRGTTRILLASDDEELRAEIGPIVRTRNHASLEGVLSTLVQGVETRTTGGDTWIVLRVPLDPPPGGIA